MKLDPRHLPYVHALQLAINRRFATPALVIVLITGLYQVDEAGYSFGDAWVSASFLILIVIGGLLGGYFVPDRPAAARAWCRARSTRPAPAPSRCRRTTSARRAIEGMVGALTGVLLVARDLPDGRQARRLARAAFDPIGCPFASPRARGPLVASPVRRAEATIDEPEARARAPVRRPRPARAGRRRAARDPAVGRQRSGRCAAAGARARAADAQPRSAKNLSRRRATPGSPTSRPPTTTRRRSRAARTAPASRRSSRA